MTEAAAPPAPAAAPAAAPSATETGIVELVKILQRLQRPDLAQRATAAAARLKRPSTIVCVVGEFKQGKSSLVNGLLGQAICPVDDDLATSAITLVRYGEQAVAPSSPQARRRLGGERARCRSNSSRDWVSEAGNPRNQKSVERVEITVPSPLLKQGLVLVDTPGHGRPRRRPRRRHARLPPVRRRPDLRVAMPRPSCRRRRSTSCAGRRSCARRCCSRRRRSTSTRSGSGSPSSTAATSNATALRVPMVAVSSVVRAAALARKDRELNERSRFPSSSRSSATRSSRRPRPAPPPARPTRRGRSRRWCAPGSRPRSRLLGDPSATKDALARPRGGEATPRAPARARRPLVDDRQRPHRRPLEQRDVRVPRRRCARSRATWTRWSRVCRRATRGTTWSTTCRPTSPTRSPTPSSPSRRAAWRSATRSSRTLGDEDLNVDLGPGSGTSCVRRHRAVAGQGARRRPEPARSGRSTEASPGIRGAQGGMMMFGMMGQFLPAAAGALLATNPVLLGIGALFGGDGPRRRPQAQGADAPPDGPRPGPPVPRRRPVRGRQPAQQRRPRVQRELRDEFTDRLGELQRTYTDAAKRAQEDAQQGAGRASATGRRARPARSPPCARSKLALGSAS